MTVILKKEIERNGEKQSVLGEVESLDFKRRDDRDWILVIINFESDLPEGECLVVEAAEIDEVI